MDVAIENSNGWMGRGMPDEATEIVQSLEGFPSWSKTKTLYSLPIVKPD